MSCRICKSAAIAIKKKHVHAQIFSPTLLTQETYHLLCPFSYLNFLMSAEISDNFYGSSTKATVLNSIGMRHT